TARAADPDSERGERAFRAAVRGEQTTAVAFEAIANSDQLREEHVETMRVLLDHAKAHVDALAELFEKQTGDDAPLAPNRSEIEGLDGLRGQRPALRLALRLTEEAIALHLDAVRLRRNTAMLRLVAGAMGTDAQHLVLLRSLLGEEPVPLPFERGT
ncbi:MAG: ferritin-like domain-containing protein, partial [Actinomycetota bacterium]|nr:ferritin-like domain-containing protein [Actinomycetota bacterium]